MTGLVSCHRSFFHGRGWNGPLGASPPSPRPGAAAMRCARRTGWPRASPRPATGPYGRERPSLWQCPIVRGLPRRRAAPSPLCRFAPRGGVRAGEAKLRALTPPRNDTLFCHGEERAGGARRGHPWQHRSALRGVPLRCRIVRGVPSLGPSGPSLGTPFDSGQRSYPVSRRSSRCGAASVLLCHVWVV